ncbi:hypothetical protein [Paraburkholderia sp. J67]|uniref:hypothetical protein n=1 Tax=Paraburkholderia sp. J67 TaxID=2805435 RepID=UPI002ABD2D3E|nr:hypothetical protein [Paraburkholderia sp. J67]
MTKIRRLTAYRFDSGRRHQGHPEYASQEALKPAMALRLAGFLLRAADSMTAVTVPQTLATLSREVTSGNADGVLASGVDTRAEKQQRRRARSGKWRNRPVLALQWTGIRLRRVRSAAADLAGARVHEPCESEQCGNAQRRCDEESGQHDTK